MRKGKKILVCLICLFTFLGLNQCKVITKPQMPYSEINMLCTTKKLLKEALSQPIIDTIGICFLDKIPRGSDKANLPTAYMDTLSIYVEQELIYRGTSHDLYLPYVGQKIQCFRYANTKRKKIATIKIVNEKLKKEKIAGLLLVAYFGESYRNWYYCDYDWSNPILYSGDYFRMEDSRCLLKYKNK